MSSRVISVEEISQKEVLTRAEAAAYLGYSIDYINRLCSRRVIPYYKPIGKTSFFMRKELEAWACRNKVKSMDEIHSEAARQ